MRDKDRQITNRAIHQFYYSVQPLILGIMYKNIETRDYWWGIQVLTEITRKHGAGLSNSIIQKAIWDLEDNGMVGDDGFYRELQESELTNSVEISDDNPEQINNEYLYQPMYSLTKIGELLAFQINAICLPRHPAHAYLNQNENLLGGENFKISELPRAILAKMKKIYNYLVKINEHQKYVENHKKYKINYNFYSRDNPRNEKRDDKIYASTGKSVGDRWLRKIAKLMVEHDFQHFFTADTICTS